MGLAELYENTWKYSEGYIYLGRREVVVEPGMQRVMPLDMYSITTYRSKWYSVSFGVRWDDAPECVSLGDACLNAEGYWDVYGGEDIHFASNIYFSNHHIALVGNSSAIIVDVARLPRETIQ